jgi:hypothetical protein
MFVFMHPVYHGEFRNSAVGLGCVRSVSSSWIAGACLLGAGTAQSGEEAACATIVEARLQPNESRGRKPRSESLVLRKNTSAERLLAWSVGFLNRSRVMVSQSEPTRAPDRWRDADSLV